jgi:DNA primase
VEGVFDVAKVWQAGHRNVVALMGSRLWNAQALLHQHFRSAFLILDGDAGGQAATEAITWRLATVMTVDAIHLKLGEQPDQLTPREIHEVLPGHSATGERLGAVSRVFLKKGMKPFGAAR